MKRLIWIFIWVLSLPLQAQKFGISIESGPTIGILKKDITDAAFPHNNFYSLGSGISTGLNLQIFPDSSNWYFSTGFELYQSSQAITAYSNMGDSSYKSNARSINSLRFQTQLAYSFNIGRLKLDLRAGFLIPLISGTREFQYTEDSTYKSMSLLYIQQYPSFGFKGGLNFNGPLIRNNKLKWFINLDLTLLNSKVKSAKYTYYKDTRNRSLEEVYPGIGDREFIYHKDPSMVRNNKDVLPASYNKDKATDKLTYVQSLNSVNLRFGFQFLF